MKTCKNCDKELMQIEGKRKKVFCDDKCRMAYNRKLTKSEQGISEHKSEQQKTANPNKEEFIKEYGMCCEENGSRIVGKCRWCGIDIKKEVYGNNWNLVECCYDCVAKRNSINRGIYPKN